MDNLADWGQDQLKSWAKQATFAQVSGPYSDPCPFGYGTNCGGGHIDAATKDQVANILSGILGNLQSHKALAQKAQKVTKNATLPAKNATLPAKKISADVKHAMSSLIARMQTRVQQTTVKDALVRLMDPDNCGPGSAYFGACGGSSGTIDSATKAKVASILEGILGNLQSQH
eukprot:gnl/TRDRNA2_/TRDRNA2_177294_c2_seq1.p1 gnl/TRDRNA2_/TRDRNA2_177294_c2~~gnl/TRDRNA2_/TRDRNA2_177294_c2_seq1.p1  ORF type:complete len:173 (-),score=40.65 gnl/TRDRNA2_/TRDRNA2_177294_c2_seq1:96-614(-)